MRVLPCDHGYHAKCIDPWLVKTKRICPQCRKKVFESNDRGAGLISASDRNSDSDSDVEAPPQAQISSTSSSINDSIHHNREESSSTAPLLGRRRREYRFFRRGASGGRTGQRSRRAAGGGMIAKYQMSLSYLRLYFNYLPTPFSFDMLYLTLGTFTSQSSVHAPPRNTNATSHDQQLAGPSGLNRANISTVERLQRAFARESRQQGSADPRYRHIQENNSSENEYQSENLSDDSSDDETTASMFHPQSRNLHETGNASAGPERVVLQGDTNRQSGAKSKASARHVSAEVHVVPLDDRNVEEHENEQINSLRVNQSIASSDSSRSQNNELSENTQTSSQGNHIVEIHADEEVQSTEVNTGKPSMIQLSRFSLRVIYYNFFVIMDYI